MPYRTYQAAVVTVFLLGVFPVSLLAQNASTTTCTIKSFTVTSNGSAAATTGNGINKWDSIVGAFQNNVNHGMDGFKKLSGGGVTQYTWSNTANGLNDSGVIVGAYTPSGSLNTYGYLYKNGTRTTLRVSGTTYTSANGINSQGNIAGRMPSMASKKNSCMQEENTRFSTTLVHPSLRLRQSTTRE